MRWQRKKPIGKIISNAELFRSLIEIDWMNAEREEKKSLKEANNSSFLFQYSIEIIIIMYRLHLDANSLYMLLFFLHWIEQLPSQRSAKEQQRSSKEIESTYELEFDP